jgi:hypothetical protein
MVFEPWNSTCRNMARKTAPSGAHICMVHKVAILPFFIWTEGEMESIGRVLAESLVI